MAARMLLAPEFEQKGRHVSEHGFGPMHLGVAAGTERDHQVKKRSAGHPVMHIDRALVMARSAAHPAGIAVPF